MQLIADISQIRVSCLMVTLATPERFPFLQRSIAGYCQQTHRRKELVVVINGATDEERRTVRDYIGSLGRDDIRTVIVDDRLTVGDYRNISIEHAMGELPDSWPRSSTATMTPTYSATCSNISRNRANSIGRTGRRRRAAVIPVR